MQGSGIPGGVGLAAALTALIVLGGPSDGHARTAVDLAGDGVIRSQVMVQNRALVPLTVDVRHGACLPPEVEATVDRSWRTAKGELAFDATVSIQYDRRCTLEIKLSCNGCDGRWRFETTPGGSPSAERFRFLTVKPAAAGSGSGLGEALFLGLRQVGNEVATCTGGRC